MVAQERLIRVGFLNVVASPHPDGVYERLFRYAANKPVRYWGDNTAAITPIRARAGEPGLFVGQILTWVEIDPRSPAIDKSRLEEVTLNDDAKRMTTALGFNSRVFRFILDTTNHLVSIESLTDSGNNLSPRRALSIFERLLSPAVLGANAEIVDVTVVPEDDALSYVLSLHRLDRVAILVKRPNPDDLTPETLQVLDELRSQNAKRQEIILSRAPQTDGLHLSETNKRYAQVAAEGNGYVSAKGQGPDGEPQSRSTREYPKIVQRAVAGATTFLTVLAEIARQAREGGPVG